MSTIRRALAIFWARDNSILLGGFFVAIFLILYIWWSLANLRGPGYGIDVENTW